LTQAVRSLAAAGYKEPQFTLDNPEAVELSEERRSRAHAELKRWLAGDHSSNNTYR
jgi:glyoxylase I family protein